MTDLAETCEFEDSIATYIRRFPYKIRLRAGFVYSPQFKEFHLWCDDHLGAKYKDWFLTANGKTEYILYLQNSKWGTFLALKYSDIVDSTEL